MQPVNQQKAILAVAVVAVIALLTTTFVNNESLIFNVTPEQKAAIKQEQEAVRQSVKFAPDSQVDEQASKLVWEKVLDEKQILQQIQTELGVNLPYQTPKIDNNKIKLIEDNSEAAVKTYFGSIQALLADFQSKNEPLLNKAWGYATDPAAAYELALNSKAVLNDVYNLPVPKPALESHKGLLVGLEAQNDFVATNDLYVRNLLPRGKNPWQGSSTTLVAFKESSEMVKNAVNKVALLYPALAKQGLTETNRPGIKVANAQVPTTTVTDIPRAIRELLEGVVTAALTNYAKSFILQYIETTEKKFMITNYLHYTDALVNVKYADSFLAKYVDPQDRQMVKNFLPQYSCGQGDTEQIRSQLRDKALAYLGFDPTNLDPTDPNFYDKLLKASNPDSSGAAISTDGAVLFNKSLAIVTEAEAQRAANQELIAPGKKVPIANDLDKKIQVSLDYLTSKMQAAIKTVFDFILPTSAAKGMGGMATLVMDIAGQVIQQFGIAGAVVIQEQKVCLKVPVFNPIVPPNPGQIDVNIPTEIIQSCIQDPSKCPIPEGPTV